MTYEIDRFYDFPVVGGTSPTDKQFILEVDTPDGKSVVPLTKLAFQQNPNRPVPHTITCRVKSFNAEGLPILAHALSSYVFELYNKAAARGEYLEAEVVGIPANPTEEPFTIRDRHGILYRLIDKEGLLTKGQIVHCKFVKLASHYFEIKRVDEGANLPYYSPDYLLDAVEMRGALRSYVKSALAALPEFESVRAEIKAKNPLWILTAARVIQRCLPDWYIRLRDKLKAHNSLFTTLLCAFRDVCLYLIEGSGFLNAVPYENQRSLQLQFTEIIDSLEPFYTILELFREDGQVNFVERLLDKLQRSGYLYHPARQFAVLMLIFRMDPDKVGAYLNRIFESIFSRDLENWKREPFRSAFVEQFEIYVHQMRSEIDSLPLAETREQKQRLETVITAIALQLILADSETQQARSRSLFYRYISLLRPESCEKLLSKSFLALLGVRLGSHLNYKQLKQPMMMMTQATVMADSDFLSRLGGTHRFNGPTADIDISAEGITLSRPGLRDFSDRVIPETSMPWLRPQIRLENMRSLTRSRKLEEHKRWWRDVETSLLAEKSGKLIRPRQLKTPEPDDYVYIVVNGVEEYENNNPTFRCTVHDDEYTECSGTLKREDIVGYNINMVFPNTFKDKRGNHLGYNARVIGQNPDGSLRFSLLSEVKAYQDEVLNFNDEYLAVVASSKNIFYGTQLGISRLGFGVSLKMDKDVSYPTGTLVYFHMRETDKTAANPQGREFYVVRTSDDPGDNFDKLVAFYDLMQAIGYEPEPAQDGDASEDLVRDIDELLTPDDVREIIEIIRFRAYAQSDLISAYDYLSFAGVMASIIGDEKLRARLEAHAELLILHQFYATNSRVDSEALENLRPIAQADPAMALVFRRLEIVSWLGDSSHNAELFSIVSAPACELEGIVAQMVLASNLLADSDNGEKSVVPQIKQQLMSRLNVNSENKRGKYYGLESKFLEFKTSLVFPAVGRGEQMRTDPAEQQRHILSRIAGMLNSDGGQLMLGVNDHGYEVGMHDDFEYYRRNTMFDGKGYQKISSLPDLCKFLELLINNRFGKTVARKINVSVDCEAEKGVVLIDIERSLEPVFLDGHLFVRQSGEVTQEYHGREIDDFVAERQQLNLERAHQQELKARVIGQTSEQTEEREPESPLQKAEAIAPAPEPVPEPSPEPAVTLQRPATSTWRPNVLHDYEDGYVEPAGYLYFYEGYMQYSTVDLYADTNPDCRLALVIPHELSEGGFLLLGFQGEKALRIPLVDIYEKGENVEIPLWDEDALMFAAIVDKDDIAMCVFADGGGALWGRGMKIGQLDSGRLTSAPRRIHDANLDHTVAWEIAVPDAEKRLSEYMADSLGNRRYGYPMRVKEGTPNVEYKMNELMAKCQPTF